MNDNDTVVLDTTGLICPEPVMLLHKSIRGVDPGGIIEMIATDPSTSRDVPKFCHFLGHDLVEQSECAGKYTFTIKKSLA